MFSTGHGNKGFNLFHMDPSSHLQVLAVGLNIFDFITY